MRKAYPETFHGHVAAVAAITGLAVTERPKGRLLSGGGLLGGVVGVLDGLVDAAAVGDLVAVLLRPGPDLRRLRVTTGGGTGSGGPGGLGLGHRAPYLLFWW